MAYGKTLSIPPSSTSGSSIRMYPATAQQHLQACTRDMGERGGEHTAKESQKLSMPSTPPSPPLSQSQEEWAIQPQPCRLTAMIVEKRKQEYSHTLMWIWSRLTFALIRAAIICLRGSQPKHLRQHFSQDHVEFVLAECRMGRSDPWSWYLTTVHCHCNHFSYYLC